MTGFNDWSFKDEKHDKEAKKFIAKKEKKKSRKKKKAYKKKYSDGFYTSEDWRKLRYRVLRKYSATCMCCGRNPKEHGVIIHVDHIKPRSKFPGLELQFENLQLLCADCNIGKSNIDATDWRPDKVIDEALDLECLASSPL